MHRVILLALTLLTACAPPANRNAGAFRTPATPIYSVAGFDPARIAGTWSQVADFRGTSKGCTEGRAEFGPTPNGLVINANLCLDGRMRRIEGPVRPAGQGRLAVPGMEPWWILWVDSGYRTLAIGTPSGAFGFVLDRGAIPGDRLVAARELFDFNGYLAPALRPF